MAESPKTSVFSSLRGTIIVATAGLAVFVSLLGIVLYIVVSRVLNEPLYAAIFCSVLSLACISAFGVWLSKKISEPIEKAVLTAKSLERGSLATLRKESGASETNELLDSLQRVSNQIQRTANQMDEISNGNLNIAIRPNSTTDRIGNSLQKLVTKISDSIKAEKDYAVLRMSLKKVSENTLLLRRGDLSGEINQTADDSRDLLITLNSIANDLRDIVKDVRSVTSETKNSAISIQKNVDQFALEGEKRTKEMILASTSMKLLPDTVRKISTEISKVSTTTVLSLEQSNTCKDLIDQTSNLTNQLRQQVKETTIRIKKLSDRSQELEKVSKLVEDLMQRTNLIALNASIQSTTRDENNHGFLVIAEEVEKLAGRANNAHKQISTLSKSIQTEVNEVQNILESASREATGISRLSMQSGSIIHDIEIQISSFAEVHEKLGRYSEDSGQSSQEAYLSLSEKLFQMQAEFADLYDSSKQSAQIARNMETLASTVSNFKIRELDNNTKDVSHHIPIVSDVELNNTPELAEPIEYLENQMHVS
jgi:methyl-accepting chemotaxis protein